MSAQSGITVSQELSELFSEANSPVGNVRLISVRIENESLRLVSTRSPIVGRTEVEDFDLIDSDIIGSDQEEPRPIFLLYRLGDRADGKWILISYVPDHARVREKMIYASTRATLTRQLGDSNFGKTYFATSKDELTPAGYQIHKRSQESASTMTIGERQLEEIRRLEIMDSISTGTQIRSSNLWGQRNDSEPSKVFNGLGGSNANLGLNWSENAYDSLRSWSQGDSPNAWVQFIIDLSSETIELKSEGSLSKLSFPTDIPSYTFYSLKDEHGGEDYGKTRYVFIYACPSESPVKSRLIYSSSSSSVSSKVNELGIRIDKKIETSDPEEIDKDYIISELLSTTVSDPNNSTNNVSLSFDSSKALDPIKSDVKFSKPARPGRRKLN
ncbi:hypothetical protein PPACK8108_LOCUS282 [Phakopsora pachyrhizi]|uniref:ADF-H domain-containing protein n=1 Tax=Phakopsora pachyrhizi TaxID=170000 RepID=A0AAV0AFV9_PHAPC|nr:hypothetical protein PPACK8108_LOCUS282 [Phakopsora pachyrhizi]